MSRTRRIVRWSLISVGALIVLAALFVAFVLFTPPGAKLALRAAKGRDLPVRIASIDGTLARRFILHGVDLTMGPIEATLDTVVVEWEPLALRGRHVHVREAIVAGGRVHLRTHADTTRVAPADSARGMSWNVTADRLRVRGVSVDAPEHDVHVRDLDLSGGGSPDAYRAEVRVTGSAPRLADVTAFVRATGNMRAATVDTLQVLALGGEVRGDGFVRWDHGVSWRGRADGDSLQITALLPPTQERIGPVSFRVASTGLARDDSTHIGLDLYTLEGTLRERPLSARGRMDMDGDRITVTDTHVQWGSATATLSGAMDDEVVEATLAADIPALGEIVSQASGSATVRGKIAGSSEQVDVDVDVTARQLRVNTVELPDFAAAVEATAVAEKFIPRGAELRRAEVTTSEGDLTAHGTVSWRTGIEWNAVVAAERAEISLVTPAKWNLRGPVSLRAATHGSKLNNDLRAHVALESLSGTVRDRALSGSGSVTVDNEDIAVSSLVVQWGDARVQADGDAGRMLDLEFDVVAPNLAAVDSSLHGAVSLRGSASGPRKTPRVIADVTADSVQALAYAVRRLEGHVDVDVAFDAPADVKLLALGAARGETKADTVMVRVSGPRDDQHGALSLVTSKTRLSIDVQGALADTAWSGWIEEARIAHGQMRSWELRERAPVFVSHSRVAIDSLVLGAGASRLAVRGSWQRGDSARAAIDLDDLDLSILQGFLADEARITGTADAAASVSIAPDGAIVSRVELVPGPGEISLEDRTIAYEGKVTGHSDTEGVFAVVDIDLREANDTLATVDGNLSIPGFVLGRDSTGTRAIEGGIQMNCTNIAPLMAMIDPSLTGGASGTLTAELSPVGSVNDFRIMGRVVLQDGRVDLRNGMQLRDTDLTLVSDGKGTVSLDGAVTSGGGRVVLKAESARSEKGWVKGTFTAKGERFLLVNQPEARVYVSPDLNVATSERVAHMTGRVHVPYARIETAEVPASAVSPSTDVVIVEDTLATKPAWQLKADVQVVLGDSVTFAGFGLQARLGGDLAIHDESGQPTRARGEIQIVEGKYRAYGTELRIDQGRFVFGGGAIDNPGLDVRATRGLTTQNVMAGSGEVVGLNLRGTLREPEMTLFSSPPMSDSEIMSYLVLGRPLDSGEDQSALASAALLVGMQKGSGLAGDIGGKFTLDEAYIEAGDEAGETSFVAGKYLSSKLFVAYATGLFEKTNTFRVRYAIDRKWTLQAESGDDSSTDLLYWFERGKKFKP